VNFIFNEETKTKEESKIDIDSKDKEINLEDTHVTSKSTDLEFTQRLVGSITVMTLGVVMLISGLTDFLDSFSDGLVSSPIPREIRKIEANQGNE
jgi:hypothetical protein